jgi:hypothetical protein
MVVVGAAGGVAGRPPHGPKVICGVGACSRKELNLHLLVFSQALDRRAAATSQGKGDRGKGLETISGEGGI